ncbi:pentapeptide repeat-containing protein [Halobacteriovorax sp. DPLXC-1]|uniref:pentapeptide repeat-containing protein n=1 Tax=unclassified Halobacteriovorax TaxID=2639665 RepID=UPI002FF3F52C
MATLTNFIMPEKLSDFTNGQFEVIENEVVKSSDLSNLTVSGSLFSQTTFVAVHFKSCTFFGSKIKQCKFINCVFENCTFEFSHIEDCNFESSRLVGNTWKYSTLKGSSIEECEFDLVTFKVIKDGDRNQYDIFEETQDIEEIKEEVEAVLSFEQALTSSPKQWGTNLINFIKSAA